MDQQNENKWMNENKSAMFQCAQCFVAGVYHTGIGNSNFWCAMIYKISWIYKWDL